MLSIFSENKTLEKNNEKKERDEDKTAKVKHGHNHHSVTNDEKDISEENIKEKMDNHKNIVQKGKFLLWRFFKVIQIIIFLLNLVYIKTTIYNSEAFFKENAMADAVINEVEVDDSSTKAGTKPSNTLSGKGKS